MPPHEPSMPDACTPTIRTASGLIFDLLQPDPATILIGDIATGLSNCCRFAGQCKTFYSVAQHSLMVASLVPEQDALAALLHDAAEAYVGDITRPLKALLPEYRKIEKRIQAVIAAKFGIDYEPPPCVTHADMVALATEKRDLMTRANDVWQSLKNIDPHPVPIQPMDPPTARYFFLQRFHCLAGQK